MRTILVGNGKSVLDRKLGTVIDHYDFVVRLNRCPTKGFEEYVGARTDLWVVSVHGIIGKFQWPNETPQPPTMACLHLKDIAEWRKRALEQDMDMVPLHAARKANEMIGGYYASTGLLAAIMLAPCDVIGFDHWTAGNRYGDDIPNPHSHFGEKEKAFFDQMEFFGWIRRL